MNRSTAALLIAIMFHLLLLILFYFLMHLNPKKEHKPQEHRIKVALKNIQKPTNKPVSAKKSPVPVVKAPPMPKGEQLKALPKEKVQKKLSKTFVKPKPPKQTPQQKPYVDKTVSAKMITTRLVKNEDHNISKPVQKKSLLYSKLSTPDATKAVQDKKTHSSTHISENIKEAYGEAFGKLSEGEKKYIIDNQEIMRRITQEQLNRLGPVNIPRSLHVNTGNIIEFYLHPNGDISGLKVISISGYEILDDTSLQTVEYSYHRYPLPKQKTLVRYKVGYYLDRRP